MAPYDSDSSGGEEEMEDEFTETNVLLGYASKEASDDTISQIGGVPTWLNPLQPPSSTFAKCKICNQYMSLLLQLDGDLPKHFPGHERRLYVWSCRGKTCRRKEGSVRVLRGTRITSTKKDKEVKEEKVEKAEEKKEKINLGEALFGGKSSGNAGGNPFATSSSTVSNPFSSGISKSNPFASPSSTTPVNPFSSSGLPPLSELAAKPPQNPTSTADLPKTFAAALSLNNPQASKYGPPPPPEPWPTTFPQPYPQLYISEADYEVLEKEHSDISIPQATMDLDEPSGGSGGGKEDKEIYESSIDKTFQKFADRLAQNPEQVIRYEYLGSPLLYSTTDSVGKLLSPSKEKSNQKVKVGGGGGGGGGGAGMPRCGNCGAKRVFEVQLCPHLITELEREDEGTKGFEDGMEWGTVLMGVCERDCVGSWVGEGEVGWVEEWCGVQWEELR